MADVIAVAVAAVVFRSEVAERIAVPEEVVVTVVASLDGILVVTMVVVEVAAEAVEGGSPSVAVAAAGNSHFGTVAVAGIPCSCFDTVCRTVYRTVLDRGMAVPVPGIEDAVAEEAGIGIFVADFLAGSSSDAGNLGPDYRGSLVVARSTAHFRILEAVVDQVAVVVAVRSPSVKERKKREKEQRFFSYVKRRKERSFKILKYHQQKNKKRKRGNKKNRTRTKTTTRTTMMMMNEEEMLIGTTRNGGRSELPEEGYVFSILDEFYDKEEEEEEENEEGEFSRDASQGASEASLSSPMYSGSELSFTPSSATDDFMSNAVEVRSLKTPPLPPMIPNVSDKGKKSSQGKKANVSKYSDDDDDDDFGSVVFFNLDEKLPAPPKKEDENRPVKAQSKGDNDYVDTSDEQHREYVRHALESHAESIRDDKINRETFFSAMKEDRVFSLLGTLLLGPKDKKLDLFGEWLNKVIMQRAKAFCDSKNPIAACFFYLCCNCIKEATAMALNSDSPYLATMIVPLQGKIKASMLSEGPYKEIDRRVLEVTKDGLAYLGYHFWTAMRSDAPPKTLREFLEKFLAEHGNEFIGSINAGNSEYGGDGEALILDFIIRYAKGASAAPFKSFLRDRKADFVILWILSTLLDKKIFNAFFFGSKPGFNVSGECLKCLEGSPDLFEWVFHVKRVEGAASAGVPGSFSKPDQSPDRMALLKRNMQTLTPEKVAFLVRNKLFWLDEIASLWEEYKFDAADLRLFEFADIEHREMAVMNMFRNALPSIVLSSDRKAAREMLESLLRLLAGVVGIVPCAYAEATLAYFVLCDSGRYVDSIEDKDVVRTSKEICAGIDGIPEMKGRELEMLEKLLALLLDLSKKSFKAGSAEGVVMNLVGTRFVEYAISYVEENCENPAAVKFFSRLRENPLSKSTKAIIDSSLISMILDK